MRRWKYVLQRWINMRLTRIGTTRIIAVMFLLIILIGALLLMTPAAARDGVSCGFTPALFTATSATCVTGLVMFDTWTQFSGFGQAVILCLIQIGGLGFMSMASIFVFLLRRRVSMKQRLLMAQAMSVNDVSGIVRMQLLVLKGTFLIEGTGAVILTARFWPEFGFVKALKWGVFHSVSAFCNAGFDIMGSETPGMSIIPYNTDPVVNLTLGALVVLGGLGFFVWEELWRLRSFKKLSVYSRLVLIITAVLLVFGTACILILEWNNPATLGAMTVPQKILAAFFQSITVRTAGFAGLDQAALTEGAKAVSILLMLVGGSSGSTAGGMKTVTILVVGLFLVTRARGRETVTVFRRTIPNSQVLDAMTISTLMVLLAVFGGVVISASSGFSFLDGLYEAASAIATVGLSSGGSANLNRFCQYLIILYMYFGRVGVLTISLGFLMGSRVQERYRCAETKLLIG